MAATEGADPDVRVVVIMGVASSGKTTVGTLLGERLGWPFRDADSFHPAANVAKMSSGVPLDDSDRAPWLAAIAAWIRERIDRGETGIVSCSALKRTYREILAGGCPAVRIVHLAGDRTLIGARMAHRRHHFMPASLLDSQFQALEPPAADENVLTVDVALPPEAIVDTIVRQLGLVPAALDMAGPDARPAAD